MTEILKVLKSMQFWLAAITLIVTAIAAWPVVEKWIVDDPIVYVGNKNVVEADKQIVLHYILPEKHKEQKAVVPFPIGFENSNGTSLDKFFITATAKAKETSDNGWMQRLLPFGYYFAQSDQKNGLLQNNSTNYSDGMQVVGNPDSGINFASNTRYENVLALNLAGEGSSEVWDEFSLLLTVGANNCNTKEYKFAVRCYFAEDVEKSKQDIINRKSTGEQEFLIMPNYSFTRFNQDSIKIPMFEVSGEADSIVKL